MGRFPHGHIKQKETCSCCGEIVWNPLWYRGEPYHKGCYRLRSQDDFDNEVFEPYMDQVKDDIEDLLSNMNPMSEG